MERTGILTKRLPKFIGVNVLGTAVDTIVLWVFSHYILKGYVGEYIISPVISFECAVLSNYIFSYFGIWKERRATGTFFKTYIIYNISFPMPSGAYYKFYQPGFTSSQVTMPLTTRIWYK
jgi:putative flippase GtrA